MGSSLLLTLINFEQGSTVDPSADPSAAENEISFNEEWTAKDILNRGIKLLNFMETRWNISLGENQDKIKFLNLSFVLQKET